MLQEEVEEERGKCEEDGRKTDVKADVKLIDVMEEEEEEGEEGQQECC